MHFCSIISAKEGQQFFFRLLAEAWSLAQLSALFSDSSWRDCKVDYCN